MPVAPPGPAGRPLANILLFFSSLVIYGMVQELFSEMFSQELDQKLQNKLNLELLEKLEIEQHLVKEVFNFFFFPISFILKVKFLKLI